jgi:DNA-binding transcriptional regulator YiaG
MARSADLVILDKTAYMIRMNTTMTTEEYRKALERLQMTQGAAGELFGVGSRTARRWALGEARIPGPVAILLHLMLKKKLKLEVPASPFIESKGRVWTLSADYALLE